MSNNTKVFLIGGGIGSLAAAAFLMVTAASVAVTSPSLKQALSSAEAWTLPPSLASPTPCAGDECSPPITTNVRGIFSNRSRHWIMRASQFSMKR
jgi:hypothetical protein